MGEKLIRKILLIGFTFILIIAFQNCSQSGFGVVDPPIVDSGSNGLPEDDPLFKYAWHLSNTGQKVFSDTAGVAGFDLNLRKTWAAGIYGQNVTVQVSDDGVENTHEDLSGNFLLNKRSRDYFLSNWTSDNANPTETDSHGTSVAGLIAAVGGNGLGSSGVAPKAKIIATNFMSDDVPKTASIVADQAKGEAEIVNMSWGFPQTSYNPMEPGLEDEFEDGVLNGRAGLGTIYIKSSGNGRVEEVARGVNDYRLGFSLFDDFNNTPYTMVVTAYLAKGVAASYASPGANVWVSSPGGYNGIKAPAMVTTDRKGCSLGYANSALKDQAAVIGSGFEKGSNGNSNCNYTVQFNGTSSAAPTFAGSVALLLSAYPKLTWRDVKYIIAKTATETAFDFDPKENYLYQVNSTVYADHKSPAGYVWDDSWITNAAGFRFSNYFGFGRVNVDKAIEFASTYKTIFKTAMVKSSSSVTGLNIAVPDFSATGETSTIAFASDITIEGVQITPDVVHPNAGELAIELISPRGLRSVVVPMNNAMDKIPNIQNSRFLTNAFYQESSMGTWTMKVIDGRAGNAGSIKGWKIEFSGMAK